MDWDGEFAEVYNFESDHSNILVFDDYGKLIHQTARKEVENAEVMIICQKILTSQK